MPLQFSVGDTFPDATLPDDRGERVTVGEVANGQPLFLAFFRGPWWPKCQLQLRELVEFSEATKVSYQQIATVSVDPPRVLEAFKAGLGARFPMLSDEDLALTDTLGIRESTDRRHGPLPVPFTFALLPDLTIHRIFNGWYMVGRPTPEELRTTARAMTDLVVDDLDFRGD